MENFINFLILSHESEEVAFGLNTDILETNLINIVLLIALLVSVLGNFLNENLSARQQLIITSVQDAEKRFNEASERLIEAKAQWSQAIIIIEEIKTQTKLTKIKLLDTEFNEANQELSQRFNTALMVLRYREQQVLNDVMKQVAQLALNQVIAKMQTQLGKTEQALIIDNKINRLGGVL
jgi:F-type H+-transporting ATPase subunit b